MFLTDDFFWTLVVNGLFVGSTYALIALGFVLIYKATGAINFAQGELVMLGGFLVAVMLSTYSLPLGLALFLTVLVMFAGGFLLERTMLRPLIGRSVVAIIMASIGLASVIRGIVPIFWGVSRPRIDLPIPGWFNESVVRSNDFLGIFVDPVKLVAAGVALGFLAVFAYLFQRTRLGIAMRAVADDQQAAMALGINVRMVFGLSWAIAGVVAAVGGVIWGNLLGVNIQLNIIGLVVFPVIILGGLDSILGAIVAGLIVGVVENMSVGYLDTATIFGWDVGGGTAIFTPFVLILIVLAIRPYGLFGRETIERV